MTTNTERIDLSACILDDLRDDAYCYLTIETEDFNKLYDENPYVMITRYQRRYPVEKVSEIYKWLDEKKYDYRMQYKTFVFFSKEEAMAFALKYYHLIDTINLRD